MLINVLTAIYILFCIALIVAVLMHSGRSASLGVVEGGSQSLFGQKKGLDGKLSLVLSFAGYSFHVFYDRAVDFAVRSFMAEKRGAGYCLLPCFVQQAAPVNGNSRALPCTFTLMQLGV